MTVGERDDDAPDDECLQQNRSSDEQKKRPIDANMSSVQKPICAELNGVQTEAKHPRLAPYMLTARTLISFCYAIL